MSTSGLSSRSRLFRVSYQFGSAFGSWVDDAIRLAGDLVADGWEGAATTEVASLSLGAARHDADPLIRDMLAEHGIPMSAQGCTARERLHVVRQAFANSGISVGEFASEMYGDLPPWDEQDPVTRQLVVLLDRWESAGTPPQEREALGAEMRAAASRE